ncbi:CHAT domain-containing protein [Cyanobium usitatum]|nr:CHAT domain-containing protein [Cyanobium usitatum]
MPSKAKRKRRRTTREAYPKSEILYILNIVSGIFATCSLMLLNPTIAPAYTKSSTDKPTKEKPVSCGLKAPSNKRSLNKKEETQISSIITEVESLESKGLYEQAANQYFDAQKIIMDAEGSCSVNSGRFRLVYGSKLYRAFRLEEAEEQIKKGLEILQLHSVGTRETCEEFNGGIEFLDEIYTKKQDFVSLSDIFFKKWPFLKKCLETQGEVTKPALFNIFIRLSGAFFSGYVQEDNEALRSKRAELAFDSLNKAYSVVGGKPTQMQLADILLKEGYFKYSMAGVSKNNKRSDLLLRAREATSQALRIHTGLNELERAEGSAKQLAYILESIGDYSQADKIYRNLIARALDKPLRATSISENYSLLSGYAMFTKNWDNKIHFRTALLMLRQWEHVALKALLPSITPKERIEYLNLFSQSEGVAARGFATGILSSEEYLDSFLQLRYSLIESEIIALRMSIKNISPLAPNTIDTLARQMAASDIDYTNQIKRSLRENDLFIQFIEPSPGGYNTRISTNEIETKTQAFVVRNGGGSESLLAYKTCEKELCNRLMSEALRSSSQGLGDASQKWRVLLDNLFSPELVKQIQESKQVYIGLDGLLQRVPIGIIRIHLESKGLGSRRIIAVQSVADIGNHERNMQAGDSTVFYSPEFGESAKCTSNASCQKQWKELVYSSKEGEVVSGILSANKVFGKQASKSSMLSIKSPKVLHISTHAGFAEETTDGRSRDQSEFGGRQVLDGLYNIYIVATGANVSPPESTIITYRDLAGWDLSGTSLAVVSACETGLGGSMRGYGLFGMHRILSSVGAESTLLSMWKVDDEATAVLMSLFYKSLKEGNLLDEALAKAQDRMIKDPEYAARGWSNPYYWAGWQIAGKMTPVFNK